jgi:NRPS condensation-like uncharacterized protein
MKTWFRLDNSALIYPMSITFTTQSLFRISVEANECINKERLLSALKTTLNRFGCFKVLLRKGFFRYFFYKNENDPVVFEDSGLFLYKINFNKNNRYLFKVSTFEKRISIDFFHGLCDGMGALEFTRSLLFNYLVEMGAQLQNDCNLKLSGEQPSEEFEDAFLRYNKPVDLFGGVIDRFAGKTAFQIEDKFIKNAGYNTTEISISVDDLKAISKRLGVSITALLAGCALLAVAKTHYAKGQPSTLTAAIPVDLRRHFASQTLLNFTTIVKCKISGPDTPHTLEAYCQTINEQLKTAVNKKDLEEQLSASNLLGTKPIARIMPLFLKTLAIKIGKHLSGKTKQTLLVSNLSQMTMPKGTENYIKKTVFNLNVSPKMPLNMAVITFNNTVNIALTSRLANNKIEEEFLKTLAAEGAQISTVTNGSHLTSHISHKSNE